MDIKKNDDVKKEEASNPAAKKDSQDVKAANEKPIDGSTAPKLHESGTKQNTSNK